MTALDTADLIEPGQWAVIRDTYSDAIGEVTKVSAKQVRTRRWGDREAHHRPEDVIFTGTEKQARDLMSVLKGLDARNNQARQQLANQHEARREAAILRAKEPQA